MIGRSPAGAVAAVDLGATSGRVMLGHVGRDRLELTPVARFPNNPVRTPDGLHWNALGLYRSVTEGLAAALRAEPGLESIGVDSWAIDYGLIRGGRLLGAPYHYRDDRTTGVHDRVHARIPLEELYERNGLQFLPFATVYQLAAEQDTGWLDLAERLLLIPDLLAYWLTGAERAELTNASTTGLLGVRTRQWDGQLAGRLGIPATILPALIEPGEVVGTLLPGAVQELGAPGPLPVTAVGSHDTASAVVAVPATGDDFAYISSGTWSLVGVELERPVVSEESRRAGFTNEAGVDGRVRFLKNVSGLWLLSESVRQWERSGPVGVELSVLLEEAARLPAPPSAFDVADPVFIPPGDMPGRIADWYLEHGLPAPQTPPEFVRAILESLASAYADAVDTASRLTGKTITAIHVVGGGSQNELLCRLTADRAGRPVIAGPVEATALGNVLVQARGRGLVSGSLESLRALVARHARTSTYRPRV